jgi:hypothetical protein
LARSSFVSVSALGETKAAKKVEPLMNIAEGPVDGSTLAGAQLVPPSRERNRTGAEFGKLVIIAPFRESENIGM